MCNSRVACRPDELQPLELQNVCASADPRRPEALASGRRPDDSGRAGRGGGSREHNDRTPADPALAGRHERRAERRRLKRYDVLSAQLAELFSIRTLLVQATDIVSHGWIQGAWFTVATPRGRRDR